MQPRMDLHTASVMRDERRRLDDMSIAGHWRILLIFAILLASLYILFAVSTSDVSASCNSSNLSFNVLSSCISSGGSANPSLALLWYDLNRVYNAPGNQPTHVRTRLCTWEQNRSGAIFRYCRYVWVRK